MAKKPKSGSQKAHCYFCFHCAVETFNVINDTRYCEHFKKEVKQKHGEPCDHFKNIYRMAAYED